MRASAFEVHDSNISSNGDGCGGRGKFPRLSGRKDGRTDERTQDGRTDRGKSLPDSRAAAKIALAQIHQQCRRKPRSDGKGREGAKNEDSASRGGLWKEGSRKEEVKKVRKNRPPP